MLGAMLGAALGGAAEQGLDSINKDEAAALQQMRDERLNEWAKEREERAATRQEASEDKRINAQADRDDKRWKAEGERDDKKDERARLIQESKERIAGAVDARTRELAEMRHREMMGRLADKDGGSKASEAAKIAHEYNVMARQAEERNDRASAKRYTELAEVTLKSAGSGGGGPSLAKKPAGGAAPGQLPGSQPGRDGLNKGNLELSDEVKSAIFADAKKNGIDPSKVSVNLNTDDKSLKNPRAELSHLQVPAGASRGSIVAAMEEDPNAPATPFTGSDLDMQMAARGEFDMDVKRGVPGHELLRKYGSKKGLLSDDQANHLYRFERIKQ